MTLISDPRETLSKANLNEFEEFMLTTLSELQTLILSFWSEQGVSASIKSDASPVTEADLAAEQLFRKRVTERFPQHGIIGEEYDSILPNSDFQWTIDPIDGTQNFALGIPTFCIMLSLRFQNKPVVAVIDHPVLKRTVRATFGRGTYMNNNRVHIKDPGYASIPESAVILTSTRAMFERTGEGHLLDRFMQSHGITRIYYDCFSHSLVAGGNAPAAVEFNVRIWDISPTELLIEEAGGAITFCRTQPKIETRNFISAIFGAPSLVKLLEEAFRN